MFHLPDKEKKVGREQERKRMTRKTRERKKKKKSWQIETSQTKRVQKTIIRI